VECLWCCCGLQYGDESGNCGSENEEEWASSGQTKQVICAQGTKASYDLLMRPGSMAIWILANSVQQLFHFFLLIHPADKFPDIKNYITSNFPDLFHG